MGVFFAWPFLAPFASGFPLTSVFICAIIDLKLIYQHGGIMTDKEKQYAEKVKAWYSSKEGQDSLKKSVEKALENNRKYKMRRQIDPEVLRKPFTI
jgi:hypothetical protein